MTKCHNIIIIIVLSAIIYYFIGGWRQVFTWQELSNHQHEITLMKQKLNRDPNAVIKALAQHPHDPRAQRILFKILVGMKNYPEADKVYQKLTITDQELDAMYANVITKLSYSVDKKQLMLSKLKTDPRIISFYQAEVYAKSGQISKAKKFWQRTLTQLPESDPLYGIIKSRLEH